MNLLKALVAAAAVGVIVVAFQDTETGGWLPLGGTLDDDGMGADSPEPILGYDGMDRDTLIDFLGSAELDRATLLRIQAYEMGNQGRGVVLDSIADLLG